MKKKRLAIYAFWLVFFITLVFTHRYVLDILGDFWGITAIIVIGACVVGPLELLLMNDGDH
jgi:hypothetical protein